MQPTVEITPIISSAFEENAFLLYLEGWNECFVVDPGLDPEKILQEIDHRSLAPVAILNTHGHADHIAGNALLKERWPDAALMIGHRDAEKLVDPVKNLSAGFGADLISPPADRTLQEGEMLELAGIRMEVLETPGHSAGHIVLVIRELATGAQGSASDSREFVGSDPIRVMGGDLLFAGSVGRTDFPDGSWPQLQESIRNKLFQLPDSTVVYPGHGPTTTVGREKKSNPYVGA
jgi:hydroxyacylglutathione hydrolase